MNGFAPAYRICCRMALSLTVMFWVAGCGSSSGTTVNVKGKVTLDGAPLPNAHVSFFAVDGNVPAQSRTVSGTTDTAGNYSLKSVHLANYEVSVVDEALRKSQLASASKPKDSPVFADPGAGTPLAAYQPGKTKLSAQVTKAKTEINFELQSAVAKAPDK